MEGLTHRVKSGYVAVVVELYLARRLYALATVADIISLFHPLSTHPSRQYVDDGRLPRSLHLTQLFSSSRQNDGK